LVVWSPSDVDSGLFLAAVSAPFAFVAFAVLVTLTIA
jgi:hypothetical protein